MKSLLVLLVGVMLVGCSQSNYAKKKTTISNMSEFLKVNESVCSQFKSTSKSTFGCFFYVCKNLLLSLCDTLKRYYIIIMDIHLGGYWNV